MDYKESNARKLQESMLEEAKENVRRFFRIDENHPDFNKRVEEQFWIIDHSWEMSKVIAFTTGFEVQGTSETVGKLTGNKKIYYETTGKIPTGEVHHTLAQQFADEFAEVGLDVNSGEFLYDIPKAVHRLKPDGLHTTTNSLGQTWNDVWKNFFMKNPDFSKTDVLKQWRNMIDATGIGKYK